MKKPLLGRVSLFLLLMGACTPGLNEPAPVGGDRTAPGRAEGTPLADLPRREDLLRSSKFLEFKDFKTFTAAVVQATQTEPAKQFAWEAAQGFVSLKRLLEREIDNFAASEAPKFANLTAEQLKTAEARLQNDLKAYRGFITYSNAEAFGLAVSPSAYGHLLNRDGVVKIGPDLYQFTADRMKVIRGGDESRIPELFGTTTSDPAKGIEVSDIRVGAGPVVSGGRTESQLLPNNECNNYSTGGGSRVTINEELYFVNGGYQFWIKFRSLSLCFFNTYCNDRSDVSGNGQYRFPNADQFIFSGWISWTRPPIYRHTHEELICNACAGGYTGSISSPFNFTTQTYGQRSSPVLGCSISR